MRRTFRFLAYDQNAKSPLEPPEDFLRGLWKGEARGQSRFESGGAARRHETPCVCPDFGQTCALETHMRLIRRVWRIAEYRERASIARFTLVVGQVS